ncbi:MAG: hypothetical protein QJR02_03665 [Sinobacteraceae bacterium]|nr:hypothetical protein [Nevskiaceae bacterium]
MVTRTALERFMSELGRAAHGPGRVYLSGGAAAVLKGWREMTIDIDLKLDPEPPGAFAAIARLKDELDLSVELAAPEDFIPKLPEQDERRETLGMRGPVEFSITDFYAQALSKIERGHERDLADVDAMVRLGLVVPHRLVELYDAIKPRLERYPRIDARTFDAKVAEFMRCHGAPADGGRPARPRFDPRGP